VQTRTNAIYSSSGGQKSRPRMVAIRDLAEYWPRIKSSRGELVKSTKRWIEISPAALFPSDDFDSQWMQGQIPGCHVVNWRIEEVDQGPLWFSAYCRICRKSILRPANWKRRSRIILIPCVMLRLPRINLMHGKRRDRSLIKLISDPLLYLPLMK